jgi:hypothetical protein
MQSVRRDFLITNIYRLYNLREILRRKVTNKVVNLYMSVVT